MTKGKNFLHFSVLLSVCGHIYAVSYHGKLLENAYKMWKVQKEDEKIIQRVMIIISEKVSHRSFNLWVQ